MLTIIGIFGVLGLGIAGVVLGVKSLGGSSMHRNKFNDDMREFNSIRSNCAKCGKCRPNQLDDNF